MNTDNELYVVRIWAYNGALLSQRVVMGYDLQGEIERARLFKGLQSITIIPKSEFPNEEGC